MEYACVLIKEQRDAQGLCVDNIVRERKHSGSLSESQIVPLVSSVLGRLLRAFRAFEAGSRVARIRMGLICHERPAE